MATIKEMINSELFIKLNPSELKKNFGFLSEMQKEKRIAEMIINGNIEVYRLNNTNDLEKPERNFAFFYYPESEAMDVLKIKEKEAYRIKNGSELAYVIMNITPIESVIMVTNKTYKNLRKDIKRDGYSYLYNKQGNPEKIILKKGKLYEPATNRYVMSSKELESKEYSDQKGVSEYGKILDQLQSQGKTLDEAMEIAHRLYPGILERGKN